MQIKDFVLGIDTSNYTTSLAVTDINGKIVIDRRINLTVRQGERGLRQSHALFQHFENLPEMLTGLFGEIDKNRIGAVAASNRPRPVEGSYMPVFKAGVNYGIVVAAGLGVPFFEFSHQEGHLEAVKHGSPLSCEAEYLAWHLSGGTSELLHVKGDAVEIIGGSKDLSFGQVIDRIGVALGMKFPAGREMDAAAIIEKDKPAPTENGGSLKEIHVDGLYLNLSGIETQCRRELNRTGDPGHLIYELFQKISRSLCKVTENAVEKTGCGRVLFTGGVSSSRYVREEILRYFKDRPTEPVFGDPVLSSDNGVGISFLGGKVLWQSNR